MAQKEIEGLLEEYGEFINVEIREHYTDFTIHFQRDSPEPGAYSCDIDVSCPPGYPWEARAEFTIDATSLSAPNRDLLSCTLFEIGHNHRSRDHSVEKMVAYLVNWIPPTFEDPSISVPETNIYRQMPQIQLSPQPLPLKADESDLRSRLMGEDELDLLEVDKKVPCPAFAKPIWGPFGNLMLATNLNFDESQHSRIDQSRNYDDLKQTMNLKRDGYESESHRIDFDRIVVIKPDAYKLWFPELIDQIRLDPTVEACTHNMNLFKSFDQDWLKDSWQEVRLALQMNSGAKSYAFGWAKGNCPYALMVRNTIKRLLYAYRDSFTVACILRMIYGTDLEAACEPDYKQKMEGVTKEDWKEVLESHVVLYANYLYKLGKYQTRCKILQCIPDSAYCKSMAKDLEMPWICPAVAHEQSSDTSLYIKNSSLSGFDLVLESPESPSRVLYLVTLHGVDVKLQDVHNQGRNLRPNPSISSQIELSLFLVSQSFDETFTDVYEKEKDPVIASGCFSCPQTQIRIECKFWNGRFLVSVVMEKDNGDFYFVQLPLVVSKMMELESCSVCKSSVRDRHTTVCPKCFHGGHISCMAPWLSTNEICPHLDCDCPCNSYLSHRETQVEYEVESDSSQDSF